MKDTPTPREPSDENAPDPSLSTNPGASGPLVPKAPSLSLKQWEDAQPHYPFRRTPRTAIAHLFKDCIKGPPSWIIERAGKYVKPVYPWLSQQAKTTAGQNETEGS
jgi:hypothetical protein